MNYALAATTLAYWNNSKQWRKERHNLIARAMLCTIAAVSISPRLRQAAKTALETRQDGPGPIVADITMRRLGWVDLPGGKRRATR